MSHGPARSSCHLARGLSRNMAPLTLFLWPAVTAIVGTLGAGGRVLASPSWRSPAAVVMLAWHETRSSPIAGARACFGRARLRLARRGGASMLGWVTVCLAMLPAALLAHRLGLHNASWLQQSAAPSHHHLELHGRAGPEGAVVRRGRTRRPTCSGPLISEQKLQTAARRAVRSARCRRIRTASICRRGSSWGSSAPRC